MIDKLSTHHLRLAIEVTYKMIAFSCSFRLERWSYAGGANSAKMLVPRHSLYNEIAVMATTMVFAIDILSKQYLEDAPIRASKNEKVGKDTRFVRELPVQRRGALLWKL